MKGFLFFNKKRHLNASSSNNVKTKQSQEKAKDNGEKKEEKTPLQEGLKEARKDLVKDKEKSQSKFETLIHGSTNILLRVKNIFPFDLFPDEIVIDENKVSIIRREFFFDSGRAHSIMIKDITDVFIEQGPLFATLKLIDQGFVENVIAVRYLWRKEAWRARRLIQGLVVAKAQGIEISHLSHEDLRKKLEELGAIK